MNRILKFASFAVVALGLMFVTTASSQAAVICGHGHYVRHGHVVNAPIAVCPTVVTVPAPCVTVQVPVITTTVPVVHYYGHWSHGRWVR